MAGFLVKSGGRICFRPFFLICFHLSEKYTIRSKIQVGETHSNVPQFLFKIVSRWERQQVDTCVVDVYIFFVCVCVYGEVECWGWLMPAGPCWQGFDADPFSCQMSVFLKKPVWPEKNRYHGYFASMRRCFGKYTYHAFSQEWRFHGNIMTTIHTQRVV